MMYPLYRAMAGTLCVAVALSACGGDRSDSQVREAPGTVATPAAPAAAALEVKDVELGRALGADGNVVDDTDDFVPGDTIYAVVSTQGMATGATLTARWVFSDGQVVNESSQTISPTGPAFTEFHIMKPSGWPVGEYRVHILLDGNEVKSEDFKVAAKRG